MDSIPTEAEIDWVRCVIFESRAKGLNKGQVVSFLAADWGVPPKWTETIWDIVDDEVVGALVWDAIHNERPPSVDLRVPGYGRQPPYIGYGGYHHPQKDQTYVEAGSKSNAAETTTIPSPSN